AVEIQHKNARFNLLAFVFFARLFFGLVLLTLLFMQRLQFIFVKNRVFDIVFEITKQLAEILEFNMTIGFFVAALTKREYARDQNQQAHDDCTKFEKEKTVIGNKLHALSPKGELNVTAGGHVGERPK